MSSEDRKTVNTLIDRALANGARQSKADTFINLDDHRIRSRHKAKSDERICRYRFTEQFLNKAEKDAIVEPFILTDIKDWLVKQANIHPIDHCTNDAFFLRDKATLLQLFLSRRSTPRPLRNHCKDIVENLAKTLPFDEVVDAPQDMILRNNACDKEVSLEQSRSRVFWTLEPAARREDEPMNETRLDHGKVTLFAIPGGRQAKSSGVESVSGRKHELDRAVRHGRNLRKTGESSYAIHTKQQGTNFAMYFVVLMLIYRNEDIWRNKIVEPVPAVWKSVIFNLITQGEGYVAG